MTRFAYDSYYFIPIVNSIDDLNRYAIEDLKRPEFVLTEDFVLDTVLSQLDDLQQQSSATPARRKIPEVFRKIVATHKLPRKSTLQLLENGVVTLAASLSENHGYTRSFVTQPCRLHRRHVAASI